MEVPNVVAKDPNVECYLAASGSAKCYNAGRADFVMTGAPAFELDHRLKRCNFVLPKPGISIPGIVNGTKVSCTFRGGQCTACRLPSSSHRIQDNPVILFLTDEFGPAMVGGDNDCMPTIRIEGGSFEQYRRVIEWQEREGLKIAYGSVAVISLVTHACRVGHDYFWTELRVFAEWCKNRNLLLMPMVPFFPTSISEHHKAELHKIYTHISLLHYGNVVNGREHRFCLWEPLALTADELNLDKVSVVPPVFRVHELGDPLLGSVGRGGEKFYGGFSNMDGSVNSRVERAFFLHTANILRKVIPLMVPSSIHPTIPTDKSINTTIQRDHSEMSQHEGKTIILIGNSILGSCEDSLTSMAEQAGVELINLTKAGSYKKVYLNDKVNLEELWQPITTGEAADLAVISIAGNEMLSKKSFYNTNGMCHISNPKMLTDEEAKGLARDLAKVVSIVRTNFPGKIVVFGPTPRHINSCCGQLRHTIMDEEGKELDMVKYTDGVTEFLQHAISYPVNCEFVGYREIFGGEFVGDMLADGVHLEESVIPTMSSFIMTLLERESTPAQAALANIQTFRNILVKNGVKALVDAEMEDGGE